MIERVYNKILIIVKNWQTAIPNSWVILIDALLLLEYRFQSDEYGKLWIGSKYFKRLHFPGDVRTVKNNQNQ